MAKEKEQEPAKFEDALGELEAIVSQLESGAKPLEESLALYEKGIAALRQCHGILDQAEKRIRILVKGAHGEAVLGNAEGFGTEDKDDTSKVQSLKPKAKSPKGEIADGEESGQKTVGQPIDSEGPSGQNRPSSTSTKPGGKGGSKAGGSLFGSAQ